MGLAEHGEFDPVGQTAEILYLFLGARFLITKVIGGEAQYREAAVFIGGIQLLETIILIGKSTFAGGVDDEQDLAGIFVAEVDGLIVIELFHGMVEGHRAAVNGLGLDDLLLTAKQRTNKAEQNEPPHLLYIPYI